MAHDVEINGVGYRLAEDAEGEHYSLSAEPLRPPNAVTVQGEDNQKFQMRPDTLLWSLTDWSGGDGQTRFDFEQPNRWRKLTNVRVFDPAGQLKPGWGVQEEIEAATGLVLDMHATLVSCAGTLFALSRTAGEYRKWDWSTQAWGAAAALTGVSSGVTEAVTADGQFVYYYNHSTQTLYKWDRFSTFTIISAAGLPAGIPSIAEAGTHVYLFFHNSGQVWACPKSGTAASTLIYDFTHTEGNSFGGDHALVSFGTKLYAVADLDAYTTIHEIVPTSAAGAGHGYEIARLPGVNALAFWAHSGLLYIAARTGPRHTVTVLYLQPGGEYGAVGSYEDDDSTQSLTINSGGTQNSSLLAHFFHANRNTTKTEQIHQIDAISGNMVHLSSRPLTSSGADAGVYFTENIYEGYWFSAIGPAGADNRIYRANPTKYQASSSAISPWNDFGLVDDKILSSLVLACEALPADWTIYVDYATDNEDTWENAITYSTAGGTGTKAFVSTDTDTQKFRTLSIRIRMEYTGAAAIPTTGPVVLGVDALAMVAKPTKVWRLLLDLGDDANRSGGFSGQQKRENLETASDAQAVVAFKDRYRGSTPGSVVEYDAVIDSYAIILSQPGEGVAQVVLKEVV